MDGKAPTCTECGQVNGPGSRFCSGCGARLAPACPSCGAENAPGSRFCNQCGSALQSPGAQESAAPGRPGGTGGTGAPTPEGPAPGEERRPVTALFCDLVGFTPLSERLDPEDIREIQTKYFGAMRGEIERFGGMVQKYAGDAVLAFFGAPRALEDDAERAVLCALSMQSAMEPLVAAIRERWSIDTALRIGVNTGEVVSGVWEIGGRLDVDITGDAVNTAARFQSAAAPGEVLVGAETMRLTRRRVEYGPRRDLVLKGKSGTVPAYPASGLRGRLGERWEVQRSSPLVGREREMGRLAALWERARAGEGQLVTLVGDAGVGKSRLIAEFLSRLQDDRAVRLVRGRCLSYSQQVSLWLVADLLRSLCGIEEEDALGVVRDKLLASLADVLQGATAAVREEALDVFGEVLGLTEERSALAHAGAQIRRHALIRNLQLVLRAVAARSLPVVVLEDVHWMDEASGEVLTEVLSDTPGVGGLVVAAQRPGWTAPWNEWGWIERLTVRPLAESDAALLAGAVLGGMQLSQDLQQYVAERSGGNPFFVEEMLRSLEESGDLIAREDGMSLAPGAAERLPVTLTGVLLARLDRLETQVRSLAQIASVIGRSFAVRLLAQVVGREQAALELPLTALQRAEIAFPTGSSDLEYAFKHVTLRDAAYNTLLQKRRQELHLATARAIAELYPSGEYVEMIAYHYARSSRHAEAVLWLERAGDRAASIYAVDIAVGHYREALRLLDEGEGEPATGARLAEKVGRALYTGGEYDEALQTLEGAVEIYRTAGDLEAAGLATALLGMVQRSRGFAEDGVRWVQPMIDLLEPLGPSPALASLHLARSQLQFLAGRYRDTLSAATRAGELARAIGDTRLLGEAEERRGTALTVLGRPDEGRNVLEAAIPLIEESGNLAVLWRALNNAGYACEQQGRMADELRYMQRALEVADRIGNPDETAFILGNLGDTLLTLGEWQAARGSLERAMSLLERSSRNVNTVHAMGFLGYLALREGRWDEAARTLERALTLSLEVNARRAQEQIGMFLAELDVRRGRPELARARLEPLSGEPDSDPRLAPVLAWAYAELGDGPSLERAAEIAAEVVSRSQARAHHLPLIDALRVQGMVLARQGRRSEGRQAFDEALRRARGVPHPYAEAQILYELGTVLLAEGEPASAQDHFMRAESIFRRLGAQKDVERSERALAVLASRSGPADFGTVRGGDRRPAENV